MTFTIKDVRIFTGHEVIDSGYVTWRGSHIHSVGSGEPPIPIGTIISKPGHTLLPGFIDAHNHSHYSYDPALRQALNVSGACTTVTQVLGAALCRYPSPSPSPFAFSLDRLSLSLNPVKALPSPGRALSNYYSNYLRTSPK